MNKIINKIKTREVESNELDDNDILAYNQMVKRYESIVHNGFIERVVNFSPWKGKLLDVGSGPGHIPIDIAKLNIFDEIVALDSYSKMLEFAKSKANNELKEENSKIIFILSDAEDLPYTDDYFDVVICHNTLHHFPNPFKVINEIKRVTKDNGAIFVRDLIRPPNFLIPLYVKIFTLFQDASIKRQYKESLQTTFSPREWKEIFKEANIKNAVLRRHFITHMSIEKINLSDNKRNYISLPATFFSRIARKFYV